MWALSLRVGTNDLFSLFSGESIFGKEPPEQAKGLVRGYSEPNRHDHIYAWLGQEFKDAWHCRLYGISDLVSTPSRARYGQESPVDDGRL